MDNPPTPKQARRNRGAQPGNRNAYKHGFYASPFNRQEIASLGVVQNGLTDEITMLRLLMRRVMEQSNEQDSSMDDWLQTLHYLSLVANRLAKLLKTHHDLTGEKEPEIEKAFKEVRGMMAEKGWKT